MRSSSYAPSANRLSIAIDLATVQTNILVFGLAPDAPDAMALVAKASGPIVDGLSSTEAV
jgi:hypothetical protein